MLSKPLHAASDDTRLADLAARQHGVVAMGQLHALGYGRHAVQRRAETGRLHRVYRGVYAVGHPKLTLKGKWMAAVLACGPEAVLSHRDAAALDGLRRPGSGDIDVTAPRRHNIAGIRCHASPNLDPRDVTAIDGIPVTTLERTLLDVAEVLSPRMFAAALEQAQRDDRLDGRRIAAMIARHPGRHGIRPLQAAMDALLEDIPWTQSELERRFLAFTTTHTLPTPLFNQYVEGELVDVFWPERRVVVEVDGWRTHKTRRAFETDRARDAKLVAAGYWVIRYTSRRIEREPAAVAAELRAVLSFATGRSAAA